MAWISRAGSLTQMEMENNANIIIPYLRAQNFEDRTIAGILGNMQWESTINPERHEVSGSGYGLVQFTPMQSLIDMCQTLGLSPYTDGNVQLQVILAQLTGNPASLNSWYTTSQYISPYYGSGATPDMVGITATDFISNTMNWNADKLAIMFMAGYERPGYAPEINHYQERMNFASQWYNYIVQYGYTPRLDDSGMLGNFHWYDRNPFYLAGYGLPNCTTYSFRAFLGNWRPFGKWPELSFFTNWRWWDMVGNRYFSRVL